MSVELENEDGNTPLNPYSLPPPQPVDASRLEPKVDSQRKAGMGRTYSTKSIFVVGVVLAGFAMLWRQILFSENDGHLTDEVVATAIGSAIAGLVLATCVVQFLAGRFRFLGVLTSAFFATGGAVLVLLPYEGIHAAFVVVASTCCLLMLLTACLMRYSANEDELFRSDPSD
jgi:peptidoglycan/LPS O-acetylase OafA/YrhL